jgi:uncharacterized protein YndB with AHSA1/START domain
VTTSHDGTFLRDGDRVGLRYERTLRHPPERVWQALTESDDLWHWFPADIGFGREPAVGTKLEFRFWEETVAEAREELTEMGVDPDDAVQSGELLAWEPPRLLEFTWDVDHVRFELTPHDAGTILTLTTWLGDSLHAGPSDVAAGYHLCLDALAELLDTGTATQPTPARATDLQQHYASLLNP